MSSIPTEDYSFIVDSFSEFEALAHRALHEDLQSGSYMLLNDTRLCDQLCSSHETVSIYIKIINLSFSTVIRTRFVFSGKI